MGLEEGIRRVLEEAGTPLPPEAIAFALLRRPAEVREALERGNGRLWSFDGKTARLLRA